MTEERFLLKDLFNPETIGIIADGSRSESVDRAVAEWPGSR